MPIRALSHLARLRLSQGVVDVCQLAAYLLIAGALIVGFAKLGHQNDELAKQNARLEALNMTLCDATNANRDYIREALTRSRDSLPTILYYREHPDELARALRDVNKSLADLPPDPCP